jgi:hypothetical protein
MAEGAGKKLKTPVPCRVGETEDVHSFIVDVFEWFVGFFMLPALVLLATSLRRTL